jgi:L-arabinose isomerase
MLLSQILLNPNSDANGSKSLKVGLFGIGLNTYWKQYEGLEERLKGYQKTIHEKMIRNGAIVVDAGMVDNPDKARAAAGLFEAEDVSLIFVYISTYALSSTVLPAVRTSHVPVIILNLQPQKAMDYKWFNQLADRTAMTGEWLANCQACSVPEIANVFNRARIRFHQVTGTLDDSEAWNEIDEWIKAAGVAKVMRENKLGVLGHYYCGMLDVYSDLTQQSVFFGSQIVILEMDELKELRDRVTDPEAEGKSKQFTDAFDVSPDCPAGEIQKAAKTAVALDRLVERHGLGSLAYYYEGTPGSDAESIVTSVIAGNSLLTARHVPVAGEMEVKNVQAMKILDAFGAGGSFTEFYAMDFNKDVLLMGHDGPGHIAIADGRPKLKPLKEFHGKPGGGLSVEMKVKQGDVTVLAVVQTFDGKLKLVVAEGETVPGPILEIGNTNSRYKFPIGIKEYINRWCKEGPAHHCAVGVGHIASNIKKLGSILGMEVIQIC